jgi:hypothetical protein
MGQTAGQIEEHIEATKEDLGSNLRELEMKVKSVTDWKQQFKSNPMTMMGVAFGGGIALAAMTGKKKRRFGNGNYSDVGKNPSPVFESGPQSKAMETFDNIKGALMGLAATKLTGFVDELIPGFNEHFQRAGEKTKAS